jgi:uncharacterized protein DUF4328
MPESYEPLDGRRQAVLIVFVAIALISIAATVSDLLEINLMDRVIGGEDVSIADANANDDRQGIVGLIQLAGLVAGAIVFIRWLTAAYRNTDVVAPGTRRYGHGWAIGGWFVPVLGMWRPKQIVNDVWAAGGRDSVDATPGGVLTLWWAAFLISNWLANIGSRTFFGDHTPEEIRNGDVALAISDGIDVVGAILAILVVRMASDRLDDRARSLPEPSPEPSGGDWEAPERPAELPA